MKLNKDLLNKWKYDWFSTETEHNKIINNTGRFCEKFIESLEQEDDLSAFEEGSLLARDIDQSSFIASQILEAWKVFKNSFVVILQKENLLPVEFVERLFDSAQIGFLEELLKRQWLALEDSHQREKELSTKFEVADYELSIALSKKVDLNQAMNLTLDTIIRLTRAERASIMLWDPIEESLSVKAARGLDAMPFGLAKIRSGEGIAGWAFQEGKTCVVNDVRKDSRFVRSPNNQEEIKSIICLPLIAEDCKVGVINVGNLSRYHAFTKDEIKTLELIASRAALVIDNVILHEKENKYIEELKKKTDELNAIVMYMGDGVLTFAKNGHITLFNRAAEDITGMFEVDILGKDWTSVINLSDEQGKNVSIEPSFTLKKSKGFLSLPKGDRKFLSATATPLVNPMGDKIGGVLVFSDMSKEREMEKMKSEFVSIVSHDLRSPLTSVKGYAAMLLHYDDRLTKDKKKEFIDIIIKEIDRLVRLIKTYLDLGKIESGRFEIQKMEIDIISLIANVLPTYRSSELHTINMNFPENFPYIIGDPDHLEQVLHNLIGNAIKYSPNGGEVEVGGTIEKDRVNIYVRDQGIGIPDDELEGVFDKFKRIKTGHKITGAGLGLFITKNIIEAHEGNIWVESEFEKGSRFIFSLKPLILE